MIYLFLPLSRQSHCTVSDGGPGTIRVRGHETRSIALDGAEQSVTDGRSRMTVVRYAQSRRRSCSPARIGLRSRLRSRRPGGAVGGFVVSLLDPRASR